MNLREEIRRIYGDEALPAFDGIEDMRKRLLDVFCDAVAREIAQGATDFERAARWAGACEALSEMFAIAATVAANEKRAFHKIEAHENDVKDLAMLCVRSVVGKLGEINSQQKLKEQGIGDLIRAAAQKGRAND